MKINWIDRAILLLAPGWAYRRLQYRAANNLLLDKSRKYEGAAHGRRTQGWNAGSTSANAEIHSALTFLRNRSRDLVRNNPYAENAVNEIATNVVGTGIMPAPVGLSRLQEKKIKEAWKLWAEGTACDYEGHLNFYGLQELIMRTVVESGECLVRQHIIAGSKLPIPLQLQVLEGDFIDTTKYIDHLSDGGYIYYGVEFNSGGKIVAYWLWDRHPGDQIQFNIQSSRIPADEILHVFKKKRAGQFRGVPFGHSSMLRLKDLDDFEDAQLVRQKIAACFSVFITDNSVGVSDEHEEIIDKVEPGIIERLPPGKSVTTATPPSAGDSYESYLKGALRGVAAGYNMDYVTLTGDLTAVNFSSGRMGWLKFNRTVQSLQWNMFIPMFCNKAWDWFIRIAAIMGFAKQTYINVTWTPPRREMINPAQEVDAQIKSVRAGLVSWQEAVRGQGYNPEEILDEMIADAKAFDESGLKPETDPRYDANRINQTKKSSDPEIDPETGEPIIEQ